MREDIYIGDTERDRCMEDDMMVMTQIATRINEYNPAHQARIWDSGAGILIDVTVPGSTHVLCFGTANEVWTADLIDQEGHYLDDSPATDVSSDCTDIETVVAAIMAVVQTYQ